HGNSCAQVLAQSVVEGANLVSVGRHRFFLSRIGQPFSITTAARRPPGGVRVGRIGRACRYSPAGGVGCSGGAGGLISATASKWRTNGGALSSRHPTVILSAA